MSRAMESTESPFAPTSLARTHRIALIGAGRLAHEQHLPAYARSPQLEVVALCDRDPRLASDVAALFGVADVTTDPEDILAMEHVDVVDLALPAAQSRGLARRALRSGKHALLRRPLACGLPEAQELARLTREHARHLALNLDHRWIPGLRVMRTLFLEGRLGGPVSAFLEVRRRLDPGAELMDALVPKLDWLVTCFGRPTSVHASFTGSTSALVTLEFPGGHHAVLVEDLAPTVPDFRRFLIQGPRAAVRGDFDSLELFQREGTHPAWEPLELDGDPLDAPLGSMTALCRAIEWGSEPEHALAFHLDTLRLVEAVRSSAADGRCVVLEDRPLRRAA